jgi:histidine kinase
VRVAATLARVHLADVVHRDINPSNLVFNRATGQVRIIDFGIATRLSRENVPFESAAGDGGHARLYLARADGPDEPLVDHRTDLYSLGATFSPASDGPPAL